MSTKLSAQEREALARETLQSLLQKTNLYGRVSIDPPPPWKETDDPRLPRQYVVTTKKGVQLGSEPAELKAIFSRHKLALQVKTTGIFTKTTAWTVPEADLIKIGTISEHRAHQSAQVEGPEEAGRSYIEQLLCAAHIDQACHATYTVSGDGTGTPIWYITPNEGEKLDKRYADNFAAICAKVGVEPKLEMSIGLQRYVISWTIPVAHLQTAIEHDERRQESQPPAQKRKDWAFDVGGSEGESHTGKATKKADNTGSISF